MENGSPFKVEILKYILNKILNDLGICDTSGAKNNRFITEPERLTLGIEANALTGPLFLLRLFFAIGIFLHLDWGHRRSRTLKTTAQTISQGYIIYKNHKCAVSACRLILKRYFAERRAKIMRLAASWEWKI